MLKNVSVLGTGLMGAPMALNIAAAGFPVAAWNRTPAKAEALIPSGITAFPAAADAVAEADFVITMLSDGPAVSDLLFAHEVADALKAGSVVIDMSSIRPAEARAHAGRLREMGIGHIDAPVSGGTKGAEAGTLAIMAGGDQEVYSRAVEILKAMGRPVRVGPDGAGQLAKLANQAIVAITIGAVAEAMLLAEKGGADPAAIRDALKGGFADSVILQQHGQRMTTGNFTPGGFSRLHLKDLNNTLEEARNAGLTLPLTEQMQARFNRFVDELDGAEIDHSGIYLELKDTNGLT